MSKLRLYDYTASANCLKPRILLAQLDRPYERVPIDIFDGDTLTDEYLEINPARSTPVLETETGTFLTGVGRDPLVPRRRDAVPSRTLRSSERRSCAG